MAGKAEPTARKQRGKPFPKGTSGNPQGRPKGSRNRATLLIEQMFDGEAEALGKQAIQMAKTGHALMLKLALERIAPPRRDRAVCFTLPPITKIEDLPKVTEALLQAVASGELTPSEAAELGKLVDAHCRAIETADLAHRVARLEEGNKDG